MANRDGSVVGAPIDARAEIIDVISAVTFHIDVMEFDVARSMYAPGATLSYKSLFGADSPPVAADQFWNHVLTFLPGLDRCFHQTTNFDIHVKGDTAKSRSMVYGCLRLGKELWEQGGLYEHDLIRLTAGWRIRHQAFTQFWERGRDLSSEAAARLAARKKG